MPDETAKLSATKLKGLTHIYVEMGLPLSQSKSLPR